MSRKRYGFYGLMSLITLLLLGGACPAIGAGEGPPRLPANDPISVLLDAESAKWVKSYNANAGDVASLYLEDAVLFTGRGALLKGRSEIAGHYRQNLAALGRIQSIKAEARYQAAGHLVYETGSFVSEKQGPHAYLLVWKYSGGSWRRELEVAAGKTAVNPDSGGIDRARLNWVKLCNEHNPKALVETLYASDAYYYNQGRILQGWAALALEYTYMASPSYRLDLTPGFVGIAADDLAFEIGQCSGSYDGHYILVWRREPGGEWRIALDSNY